MEKIIFQFVNGRRRHVHPRIAGSIVDINLAVFPCNSAVCKYHVGDIPYSLLPERDKKYPRRLRHHSGRIFQIRPEDIQYIAQSRRRIADAVGDVDEAFLSPDGRGAGPVF